MKHKIPVSVLDLATVAEGRTHAQTFHNSLDLAKYVEELSYNRFWLAEHHNMPTVASSATAVLIGFIAQGTSSIRVGSGGIMLPNHAPLIVAEQFGTLETLYPGRIDLGLGRAPGTDQITAAALRRDRMRATLDFSADIEELQRYFSSDNFRSSVRAVPGEGLDIPIWILGSSMDSAYLAAEMGLPYAFASHFAPAYFLKAIEVYRQNFKPSETLRSPYVMCCVNAILADTDTEAKYLASTFYQLILGIVTGKRKLMQPPVENMDKIWDMQEEAAVKQMAYYSFIGGPEKTAEELKSFLSLTGVNEIMITSNVYDHKARLHSYKLLSKVISAI